MSILDNKEIEIDVSLKLKQIEGRIRRMSQQMYQGMVAQHEQMFNMIWNNPQGHTAQQIVSQFGTDAMELFVFSGQIQTMLLQINPKYVPLETPNEFTVNQDGTVTIGALK